MATIEIARKENMTPARVDRDDQFIGIVPESKVSRLATRKGSSIGVSGLRKGAVVSVDLDPSSKLYVEGVEVISTASNVLLKVPVGPTVTVDDVTVRGT